MPTNMSPPGKVAPTARACGTGLAKRPQRLSGLSDAAASGAPHSVTGSIAPADLGLPFAANLAPRGEVGN
jgi:hypothetical protein